MNTRPRKRSERVLVYVVQKSHGSQYTTLIVQERECAIKRFTRGGPVNVWYEQAYHEVRPSEEFVPTITRLEGEVNGVNFLGQGRSYDQVTDKPMPFILAHDSGVANLEGRNKE